VNSGSEPLTESGWQALYRRLERPLFNLAYRYVWHREEAQDVLHDAFLRVWAKRGSLRAETADRYLWVSVLNLARNRRRWKRLRGLFEVADEAIEERGGGECLESMLITDERDARVRAAIDALPEKLREVLLLTEFSGMLYEDVAALLGVPPGTVASRRHLAVQRLRGRLRDGDEA
jgi:RNA polymerase sigma-70 factor (ECF subfamily)